MRAMNRSHRLLGCAARLAVLASLALGGSGCFMYATREDFQIAQKEITDLKDRLRKQEEQHAADLGKLNEETAAQVKKLKELTEQATQVVTRNSANLGQDVDALKQQAASLTGRIEVAENTLSGLSKSFNDYRSTSDTKLEKLEMQQPTAKAPPVPDTADALYTEARKHYDAHDFAEAHRLLDAFINRYPKDERAAMAMYLQGDTYFQEKKLPAAIGNFGKLVDLFPKSEVAPEAMYKNGQAFHTLKYCNEARVYFQELIRRYPRSPWKKDATEQIKKIQADQKKKDACQSS